MLRSKKLFLSSEGAVAIEYGLIAGIVALGIVSALVSTKGSLNGVFNTTGTQMTVSQAQSSSENAAFWSGKGIVSSTTTVSPIDGSISKNYVYDDGTRATYTRNDPAQPFFEEFVTYNPATQTEIRTRSDELGNMNFYQKAVFDPTGTYMISRDRTSAAINFSGNPSVPTRYTSQTYDAAGTVLTNTGATTSVPTSYVQDSLSGNESLKYFRDISK